jgi:hypothetical protein
MRLLEPHGNAPALASRFDLDISRSEIAIELERSESDLDLPVPESGLFSAESAENQGSTYHDRTCTNQISSSVRSTCTEKQEHAPSASSHAVEDVESSDSGRKLRVQLLRRARSKETPDGRPAVKVIAALARHVLLRHRSETDDGELREILKTACAKANLKYDGASVGEGIERARAHLQRKGLL